MTSITLNFTDVAGRLHAVDVTLPEDYPLVAPDCRVVLPVPFDLTWRPGSTLKDAVAQIEQALGSCQEVWGALDQVDESLRVVEPERPTLQDTMRRIALGDYASVILTVDPVNPLALPHLQFMGADNVVGPLKKRCISHASLWDPAQPIPANLQAILGKELPSKTTMADESLQVLCGICYAFSLDDNTPDKACDNCHKTFHEACLSEWFSSTLHPRTAFNTIFGTCPYCSQAMSIKLVR
mmetsp:Transcript_47610/g.112037  ORF Transcript_47610/g.112037 Transcript_47610/m.112037 type:complete len:239 (+) Transcript_47610:97-813(+)